MRYWDASALVPLVVEESRTDELRALLSQESHVVTWAWSWVEVASAVERRTGDGQLSRRQRRGTLDRFTELADACDEVTDVMAVRRQALSLLGRHPLRAADAGQLGAALLVAQGGTGLPFVCLDTRLAEAAEREGLRPIPDLD